MKENYNENKVRMAFSNVKKDISSLKKDIEGIKSRLSEIESKIGLKKEDSKGNEGVLTTTLQQPYNNLTTHQHLKNTEKLDKNIKDLIFSLTDKEFLVFVAIYQQEDELKRPINYEEIGKKIKMSQTHLRGCIRDLMLKEAPITKQRSNNKIFLSIRKDFKYLKIGDKIINFRRSLGGQTNLSDIFEI